MADTTGLHWEGSWEELKGRALDIWDGLTDDELDGAEGDPDELVRRIQDRTGDSVDEIRNQLYAGHDSLLGSETDDFDQL